MKVDHFARKLLASYLTGRRSRVIIKGTLSDWIDVENGIGEGSVLGPLVFILTVVCVTIILARAVVRLQEIGYTATTTLKPKNDAQIELSEVEFADDVTGLAICDTELQVQQALQVMADEYEKYFSAHGLKINITKSEHIVIGSLRTMKVVVDGREEAKSVKLLGLTFDNYYSFSQHVDTVVRKMTARNSQLRKIANIADENTTRMVAMANVLSVANYCSEIFATNPKDVNRIQMKVNETMRIITHSGNRARIKTMMNRLNWLSYHETVMYN